MNPTPSPDALLDAAREARARAYAPYSQFQVGAALETTDGRIVTGSNVENASFGLSICAERAAIVAAVSAGYREFRAIAIAGPDGRLASPCGACRQFMAEFNRSMRVTFATPDGAVRTTVAELLPYAFDFSS
ncbi:MAG: cytidine deaminase [Candidatus Baltobacteraceae bacterium]